MLAKLKAEGSAILAWMIHGAAAWHQGRLPLPAVVRAASAEYLAAHNDVELWIDECCKRSPNALGKGAELYRSYSEWKKDRGERAPSSVTWAERLTVIAGIERRRSNGTYYAGLDLRPEEAERVAAIERRRRIGGYFP